MKSKWMICVTLLLATVMTQVTSTTWDVGFDMSYDEYSDISSSFEDYKTTNKDKLRYCPKLESDITKHADRWVFSRHLTCNNLTSDTIAASIEELNSKSTYLPIRIMTISNSNFKIIKNGTFLNTKDLLELRFENTTIETIERSAFIGLKNLTRLSLKGTNIQNLTEGSFSDLISLKELILSKNNLNDKLNGKVFSNLSTLTVLNLDENLITNIDPNIFQGMTKLTSLSLQQNLLKKLNHNMLQFTKNVSHLLLSNNTIMEIEDKAFPNQLKVLEIRSNNLTFLRAEMFENLSQNMSLKVLDISYNNIKFNKTFLSHFPNLERLLLSHNAMDEFSDLKIWSNINLSFNKITRISNLTFVLDAKYFDISHNSLTEFDNLQGSHLQNLYMNNNNLSGEIKQGGFNDFPKLETLRLDFNKISGFSNGSFVGLENLEILNISYNSINDLNPTIFYPLKKLQVLLISGNHLKTLDIQPLTKNLPSLKTLSLVHNHWTCSSLTDILNYLEGSPIMIHHHTVRYLYKPHVIHCVNDVTTTEKNQNDNGKELTSEPAKIFTEPSTQPTSTGNETMEGKSAGQLVEDTKDKQQKTQNDSTPLNVDKENISNTVRETPSNSLSGLKITIIVMSVFGSVGLIYILFISYRKKFRLQNNTNSHSYQAMEAEELL